MVWVAALDPDLVVPRVVAGVSAECAPPHLVQTPKTSFQHGLEDAAGHAAQVHRCHPVARSFVYLLDLPLLYRANYARFLAALLVGCLVWFVSRITDRGFDHAVNRTRMQRAGGESILIVLQRLTRPDAANWLCLCIGRIRGKCEDDARWPRHRWTGVSVGRTKITGERAGGISLLMDKAVHVGNFCKIGNQVGTAEDIGLRSVKLRTLDQSLLVVPNGSLAQMQFENFGPRRKCLFNQHFSLRIETQVEQLRFVLDRLQNMLDQQPAIETGTSRIRVANFAGAAFELELWAYVKTGDWAEFTAIRQNAYLVAILWPICDTSCQSSHGSHQVYRDHADGRLISTGANLAKLMLEWIGDFAPRTIRAQVPVSRHPLGTPQTPIHAVHAELASGECSAIFCLSKRL
jgi:hypothetical protein